MKQPQLAASNRPWFPYEVRAIHLLSAPYLLLCLPMMRCRRWLMAVIPFLFRCAVSACALGSTASAAAASAAPIGDISPQSYYANAHPYLEEPLEHLRKLIPELKGLQPSLDQKELPIILQKTGQRVDDFTNNGNDLIARQREVSALDLDLSLGSPLCNAREVS